MLRLDHCPVSQRYPNLDAARQKLTMRLLRIRSRSASFSLPLQLLDLSSTLIASSRDASHCLTASRAAALIVANSPDSRAASSATACSTVKTIVIRSRMPRDPPEFKRSHHPVPSARTQTLQGLSIHRPRKTQTGFIFKAMGKTFLLASI